MKDYIARREIEIQDILKDLNRRKWAATTDGQIRKYRLQEIRFAAKLTEVRRIINQNNIK